MKRIVFLCAVLLLAAVPPVYAMPGGEARFGAADTDKDGFLTGGEFASAFAGLKPEAFGLIDADKDGRIAAGEWRAFLSGHGGAAPEPPALPPAAPGSPPAVSPPIVNDGGLPVLAPPGK